MWWDKHWHTCEGCGHVCDDGMATVAGWVCQLCIDRLDRLRPGWHKLGRDELASLLRAARERQR